MPLSTSSSESVSASAIPGPIEARPGFVRLTASDRPGVAQPIPERDVPPRPWGPILIGAVLMCLPLLGGWEWYWRDFGATPAYRNSDASWAEQRRRIDTGEGGKSVLVGSSRVLFDVQLPVWEKITGERPIQLALEGTSPVPILEDLAADPNFTGRLLIGVTPGLFFGGSAFRGSVVPYYHKQAPSDRSGHWLSQHFLEPYFAFYDPDFALATIVRRQRWPARIGVPVSIAVRKLSVAEADRNTTMWRKVETDPDYRDLARSIWAQRFGNPPPRMEKPAGKRALIDTQITRATKAIGTLRARGVRVLFLRPPSIGEFYANEQKYLPRAETWEPLLKRTGAPGIHFEDYPELQGYESPEWSHLTAVEARRFTAALVPIVEREFAQIKNAQSPQR